MFQEFEVSPNIKAIKGYSEAVHIAVVKAYLIDGISMRNIQRQILGLPAPPRGGGFVSMNILHYYGISGEEKSAIKNLGVKKVIKLAPKPLRSLLSRISEAESFSQKVENNIRRKTFKLPTGRTEITSTTKQRIGQDVLRKIVLSNYNHQCAICPIKEEDLLVCSHIIPWSFDKEKRLNPENAICLCRIHDALFDKGYFSFSDNFEIILSKKANFDGIKRMFDNAHFSTPNESDPNIEFIRFHRKHIFKDA